MIKDLWCQWYHDANIDHLYWPAFASHTTDGIMNDTISIWGDTGIDQTKAHSKQ